MKKVMIVTGASRGIGAAIATQAGAAGYSVAVNYVRNGKAANDVVQAVRSAGGEAVAIRADVGDATEVKSLFAEVDASLGAVSVLVNNAGVLGHARLEEMTAEEIEAMFRANVFSMFHCAREAVRRMSTRHGGKGGVIVNLSSASARLGGLPGSVHYAATKGAVDAFTRGLAKEVGAEGIRVNAICPGLIDTDIHDARGGLDPALAKTVPMERMGSADEVARVALWLASDEASYVHGALVDVTGGR